MLKIEIGTYGNIVFGKIVEQGDEIKSGCDKFFTASNGFTLSSNTEPGLYYHLLCVRGTNPKGNNKSFAYKKSDEADALKLVKAIKLAVQEYNLSIYNAN